MRGTIGHMSKRVIVAVSGGIDSVVLLDMLMTGRLTALGIADDDTLPRLQQEEHDSRRYVEIGVEGRMSPEHVIVAHFDHGMRNDSADDARFVAGLAQVYGLRYETCREELAGQSEEVARERRYAFLDAVAAEHNGVVATAHHADDVVETVALNIMRGTRWRGVACLDDDRRWRPLQERTKSELLRYAMEYHLEWVEDESNRHDTYTRNRIRKRLSALPSISRQKVLELRRDQLAKKREIDGEIRRQDLPVHSRYFMTMVDMSVARELLHAECRRTCGVSLLTRQVDYALLAIKTGRPRTRWQIGQGVQLDLTRTSWRVQMQEK